MLDSCMAWFCLRITVLITSDHGPCPYDILFISERNIRDQSHNVRRVYRNPPYSISSQEKCNDMAFDRLIPSVHKWKTPYSCTLQDGNSSHMWLINIWSIASLNWHVHIQVKCTLNSDDLVWQKNKKERKNTEYLNNHFFWLHVGKIILGKQGVK